jgi:WD40 repeat protein
MLAITGSDDRTAAVWDTTTGVRRFVLSGHTAPVTSVAFSRDDDGIARRALTGSEDSTAKLWDIRIAAKTDGATEPDGGPAKVQDNDAPAVAEAKEATAILTLKGHAREVTSVAFSPQGRYILTGSRDGTAVIWLADNWQQPALARHSESKTSNR